MTHLPADDRTDPSRRWFVRTAGVVGLGTAAAGTLGIPDALAAAAPGADAPARTRGTRAPVRTGTALDRLPHPLVVGHRGACGYRPEHTLGSYELALELGADVIEQDLVPTRDGHLVVRHENEIGGTTDVADHPEFASRRTTRTIDGNTVTGWFTEDFTLAELRTLRAKERLPQRQHNTLYDGRWPIPTLAEVIDFADRRTRTLGRDVWLYIETKHPTYFRSIGLPLEERLAEQLRRSGYAGSRSHAILQSFEPSSLQRLAKLVGNPRIQLLDSAGSRPYDFTAAGDPRTVADLVTPAGLRWIADYAHGIGPTTQLIVPTDRTTGRLGTPTTLVADAHAAGLLLHPYTVRNENYFLPADFRRGTDITAYGDALAWSGYLYRQGVDGFFTDNADTAVLARADFWAERGVN